MTEFLLEYPANIDVLFHKLPLPQNTSTNELCLLTFKDAAELSKYLDTICDIIDELEYSSFFKHSLENRAKLKFCKWFIDLLMHREPSLN